MWRRGYTQQAQGDTPVFEQWAGLRWEGHSCGPEEEVWGPPSKEQKREDGGGGGEGGAGSTGWDSARFLGWKKSIAVCLGQVGGASRYG